MTKSPLADWGPPEDYSRAFRLVGEFMFHWAALEAVLNRSLRDLLGLKGVEGIIAQSNMQLRDKIHTFRTLVSLYNGTSDWAKAADKTIEKMVKLSGDRNVVAHNPFSPHENGGVEFYIYKAKGKFSIPEVVWGIEDFLRKAREMTDLEEEIKTITEQTIARRSVLKAMSAPRNALLPMTNSEHLALLLGQSPQAPELPGSLEPTLEPSPPEQKARRRRKPTSDQESS